ncbi:MAG TPA: lysophospholipid acyltransferase family protein [Ardenticatenaceae bacterium]|nr:lysophospholipid acyltransferase family protein [Ardenticatenaceae bacterium]
MRPLPRFYYVANWVLCHSAVPLLLRLEVRGLEKVPREGPLIVVINHFNIVDPILTGAVLPRGLEMMAKIELFQTPIVKWLVSAYGAFPVRRGEGDVEAVKHALGVLRRGGALLMAPEGTRGVPVLREAHNGVAMLATRARAVVVPVGIAGHEHFFRNLKRLRRTAVRVSVGDPFYLDAGTRKVGREALEAMTAELMQRLAAELPQEYRGQYQPASGPGEYVRPLGASE